MTMTRVIVTGLLTVLLAAVPRAQVESSSFDKMLDTYVRDGFVYYKALAGDHATLDRYVASLDVPKATIASWSKDAQKAFWINAYDALVLKTVIEHYPIKGKSTDYPTNSVRQIPGAFDVLKHRVAGESLTLDEVEQRALALGDGRIVFALGRGAIGSGRLKSEAYVAARIGAQLDGSVKEFVTRPTCLKLDLNAGLVEASPLFSWRQDPLVAAFANGGDERWKARSPIERVILNLAWPHLFVREQEFLGTNTFQIKFGKFDWRLNDLTGGMPN